MSGCVRPERALTTTCPFTDQVIVTLVYLRLQLPHVALAALYGVHRSTVTRGSGGATAAGRPRVRRAR
jgi:hypothetical protein